MGIINNNPIVLIDDLEKDDVKKQEILNLEENVKSYFALSKTAFFTMPRTGTSYLSLAKMILKDMGYCVSAASIFIEKGTKVGKRALYIKKIQ